jgi:hypothetical protein
MRPFFKLNRPLHGKKPIVWAEMVDFDIIMPEGYYSKNRGAIDFSSFEKIISVVAV